MSDERPWFFAEDDCWYSPPTRYHFTFERGVMPHERDMATPDLTGKHPDSGPRITHAEFGYFVVTDRISRNLASATGNEYD